MTRALVTLTPARAGAAVEVRCLLQHPMETGHRSDEQGRRLPRRIVQRVEAWFEGERVWAARLGPGISANPYLAFWFTPPREGELRLRWEGDEGFAHEERVALRFAP
jgi:sulfur-oxidizing protein SoxZ